MLNYDIIRATNKKIDEIKREQAREWAESLGVTGETPAPTPDQDGKEGGGRSEGKRRGPNYGTLQDVAKAMLIQKRLGKRMNQEMICTEAGTSAKTLRDYRDKPQYEEALEQEIELLKQDRDFQDLLDKLDTTTPR